MAHFVATVDLKDGSTIVLDGSALTYYAPADCTPTWQGTIDEFSQLHPRLTAELVALGWIKQAGTVSAAPRLHVLELLDHNDRVRARMNVPQTDVVAAFQKLVAEGTALLFPTIKHNGKRYHSEREFFEMVHNVNFHSTWHGGTQIF